MRIFLFDLIIYTMIRSFRVRKTLVNKTQNMTLFLMVEIFRIEKNGKECNDDFKIKRSEMNIFFKHYTKYSIRYCLCCQCCSLEEEEKW